MVRTKKKKNSLLQKKKANLYHNKNIKMGHVSFSGRFPIAQSRQCFYLGQATYSSHFI